MQFLRGIKWDPGVKSRVSCAGCNKIERERSKERGTKYVPPHRSSTLRFASIMVERCVDDVLEEETILENVLCGVCDYCGSVTSVHEEYEARYMEACGYRKLTLSGTACRICEADGESGEPKHVADQDSAFGLYIGICERDHIFMAREVVGPHIKTSDRRKSRNK